MGFSGRNKTKPDENPEVRLPGKITAITTQARDSSRVSVFIEDAFFAGFYRKSIEETGLEVGQNLTLLRYNQLLEIDGVHRLREFMIGLLSRRDHSPAELRLKAMKKGHQLSSFDEIAAELEAKGYINTERFTRQYISEKTGLKKWGPMKIKAELFKKGISEAEIERGLTDIPDETYALDAMSALISKNHRRFRRELDILKRRKKIFDFLSRKGFHRNDIFRQLDNLIKLTE